jgi:glutamate-1-semialdehyde 2,1-aminomutase
MTSPVASGRTFAKSLQLFEASRKIIPGGVTSSVRAGTLPHPIYFERGEGPYLWDVDGNRYLDFILAFGPPILGFSPRVVNEAIRDQIARGLTFGSQHRGEGALAELIVAAVPGAEQVVFSGSGSEAVAVALRIARTYTGRPKVLKFEGHYHGWLDTIFASTGVDPERSGPADHPIAVPATAGIPPGATSDLAIAPWNDAAAVTEIMEREGHEIAAIILEPLNVNGGVIAPEPGFLETLRMLATRYGAVLVYDEIITGFRLALGGAQEYYGVKADLAIYAKALAGGVAISSVAGSKDLLSVIADRKMLHNGTFNGNPLATSAAIATLSFLTAERETVYPRLTELGDRLADGLRAQAPLVVRSAGPIVSAWIGEPEQVRNIRDRVGTDFGALSAFALALLKRGVHARTVWYISTAHEDAHIQEALAAVRGALAE